MIFRLNDLTALSTRKFPPYHERVFALFYIHPRGRCQDGDQYWTSGERAKPEDVLDPAISDQHAVQVVNRLNYLSILEHCLCMTFSCACWYPHSLS